MISFTDIVSSHLQAKADQHRLRGMERVELITFYGHALWHAPQRLIHAKWAPGLEWLADIDQLNTPDWFLNHVIDTTNKSLGAIGLDEIFVALNFLSKLPVGHSDAASDLTFTPEEVAFRAHLNLEMDYQSIILNEALLLMAKSSLSDMLNHSVGPTHLKVYRSAVYSLELAAWFSIGFDCSVPFTQATTLLGVMERCQFLTERSILPNVFNQLKEMVIRHELAAQKEVTRTSFGVPLEKDDEAKWGYAVLVTAPAEAWKFGGHESNGVEEICAADLPLDLTFLDEDVIDEEDEYAHLGYYFHVMDQGSGSEESSSPVTTISSADVPVDLDFLDDFEDDTVDIVFAKSVGIQGSSEFRVHPRELFPVTPYSAYNGSVLSTTGDLRSPIVLRAAPKVTNKAITPPDSGVFTYTAPAVHISSAHLTDATLFDDEADSPVEVSKEDGQKMLGYLLDAIDNFSERDSDAESVSDGGAFAYTAPAVHISSAHFTDATLFHDEVDFPVEVSKEDGQKMLGFLYEAIDIFCERDFDAESVSDGSEGEWEMLI